MSTIPFAFTWHVEIVVPPSSLPLILKASHLLSLFLSLSHTDLIPKGLFLSNPLNIPVLYLQESKMSVLNEGQVQHPVLGQPGHYYLGSRGTGRARAVPRRHQR